MKIKAQKMPLMLAVSCLTISELSIQSGISPSTIRKMMNGLDVKPAVVGKVAKVLEVEVVDLIQEVTG